MRVAKTAAGVVDFKRARKDAFCVAGAGISGIDMSMFEALDAEPVEGLQILRHGNITQKGSFRVALTGVASGMKHPFKIPKTFCN